MRVLVSVLFSAVAVFAQDPQALVPSAQVPDNLSIPAQLSKTIDTNKCKTGDPVEMRTLEPVLIANGLVMPENTKLHGRVLGGASRQNDQPSWVVLVLESAEWRQHSIPLHAFVASQITLKAQVAGQNNSAFDKLPDAATRRRGTVIPTAPGRENPALSHVLRDATVEAGDSQQLNYQKLEDLRIAQAKNGIVFLLSQKPRLKLPSGTMFMLRNQAPVAPQDAGMTKMADAR